MYRTQRQVRLSGLDGNPPRDIVALVAVVFVTYSAQFFTPLLGFLRLTELALLGGYLWQLVTYPFIGLAAGGLIGAPRASVFILLELFILYIFAVDVFRMLGRRRFWRALLSAVLAGAIVAQLVQLVLSAAGGYSAAFTLMQGQRTLLAIIIAGFATLRANATIMLFFVLPIKAKWFLWLEIAVAFIGFLGTKDLAGFVGLLTAIGLTVWMIRHPTLRGGLRELRLRTEQRVLQRRLQRVRRKSKLKIVRGEDDTADRSPDKPWIN